MKRFDKRQINKIIIHCSDTEDDGNKNDFRAIKRYHIEVNKWQDIGYHYVIEKDFNVIGFAIGNYVIKQGRPEEEIGAHCRGQNKDSIGICLVGKYDKKPPTEEALETIRLLVSRIRAGLQRNIPIYFHRDFDGGKTCPGIKFPIEIKNY